MISFKFSCCRVVVEKKYIGRSVWKERKKVGGGWMAFFFLFDFDQNSLLKKEKGGLVFLNYTSYIKNRRLLCVWLVREKEWVGGKGEGS